MHTDNKHSLDDQKARKQALTTTDSFIVQAPAGSGKTELLIQRFLALLGEVQENPEEILAITFTRKAAAEMRQRILLALKNAQTTRHPPPSAHAATTWQLAKRALARNEQAHWNLLENPNRLSITTIDGFCNRLNSQMPLRSQINTQATLSEYPEQHYQQAARDFLASLEGTTPWSKPLTQLLTN